MNCRTFLYRRYKNLIQDIEDLGKYFRILQDMVVNFYMSYRNPIQKSNTRYWREILVNSIDKSFKILVSNVNRIDKDFS